MGAAQQCAIWDIIPSGTTSAAWALANFVCTRILRTQSAVPLDGSQSLLVFEGAERVHGLFDFLLNDAPAAHGDACDVPLLLAPVQFAGASLRALRPKVGC
jgi:hypothetical protein